jgi:hypothetical protein
MEPPRLIIHRRDAEGAEYLTMEGLTIVGCIEGLVGAGTGACPVR